MSNKPSTSMDTESFLKVYQMLSDDLGDDAGDSNMQEIREHTDQPAPPKGARVARQWPQGSPLPGTSGRSKPKVPPDDFDALMRHLDELEVTEQRDAELADTSPDDDRVERIASIRQSAVEETAKRCEPSPTKKRLPAMQRGFLLPKNAAPQSTVVPENAECTEGARSAAAPVPAAVAQKPAGKKAKGRAKAKAQSILAPNVSEKQPSKCGEKPQTGTEAKKSFGNKPESLFSKMAKEHKGNVGTFYATLDEENCLNNIEAAEVNGNTGDGCAEGREPDGDDYDAIVARQCPQGVDADDFRALLRRIDRICQSSDESDFDGEQLGGEEEDERYVEEVQRYSESPPGDDKAKKGKSVRWNRELEQHHEIANGGGAEAEEREVESDERMESTTAGATPPSTGKSILRNAHEKSPVDHQAPLFGDVQVKRKRVVEPMSDKIFSGSVVERLPCVNETDTSHESDGEPAAAAVNGHGAAETPECEQPVRRPDNNARPVSRFRQQRDKVQ